MTCETCKDGSYPQYGAGPNTCYYKKDGREMEGYVPITKEQWPKNYTEDSEAPCLGVWTCPDCNGE